MSHNSTYCVPDTFNRGKVLLVAATVSLIYLLPASLRLDAQGLYYDELHQATASFAYIGEAPRMFANLTFVGIPILNMDYSGAIKTAIYGVYLLLTDSHFGVVSWRLTGILCVFFSLTVFGALTIERIGTLWFMLFAFLVASDVTLLLTTRHDWGPVALGLSTRLLVIAFWLSSAFKKQLRPRNTFVCCLLLGLALFEKLSAIAFALPFAAILFFEDRRRRSLRHLSAGLLGLLTGGAGLVLANVVSLLKNGYLISLHSVTGFEPHMRPLKMTLSYLNLGAGYEAKAFILGVTDGTMRWIEFGLFLPVIVLVAFLATLNRKESKLARLGGLLLLPYVAAPLLLYSLPRLTWIHHWVVGSPCQYVAAVLVLAGAWRTRDVRGRAGERGARVALAILVAFLGIRAVSLTRCASCLWRGRSSAAWNPELTELGEFARQHASDGVFIASDWGVATQIQCFLDGKPGVAQFFLSNYRGVEEIEEYARSLAASRVFVVFRRGRFRTKIAADKVILRDLDASGDWVELRANEPRRWQDVALREFKLEVRKK